MIKFKSFLLFTIAAFMLGSCTIVTSTNLPGKNLSQVPKKMRGTYELQLPEDMSSMMGENKLIVTLEANQMITDDGTEKSSTKLGDSLYFSSIKKDIYMSLGATPNLTVYKVVRKGKDLELYSLFGNENVTSQDLAAHFSKVEEVPGEIDENGEVGPSTYSVTIDDSKLAGYFKSGLSMKDPYILKRKN